jgi:hypothetical protein
MNTSSNVITNDEASREKRNEQIVRSLFDDVNMKNPGAMYQLCAPNYTDYGDSTTPKPMPPDSFKTMFNSFMTAFPDFAIQNPKAVADGDTVMVWATDIGTWKGDLIAAEAYW